MAITYDWNFPSLGVTFDEDGLTNVVNTVHWIYIATDGDYSASVYGSIGLPAPGQPFVDYEDLTKEIVQGWVESVMGEDKVDAMTTNLANQIADQKAPKTGTLSPPWA